MRKELGHYPSKYFKDLYFSQNFKRVTKSRSTRWDGHIARIGDRKVAHGVSMGRYESRPLRRRRRRWANNIKKDLRAVRRRDTKWNNLT